MTAKDSALFLELILGESLYYRELISRLKKNYGYTNFVQQSEEITTDQLTEVYHEMMQPFLN